MDGHPTNMSMAELLGCQIDLKKPHFQSWFTSDSGNKIFVMLGKYLNINNLFIESFIINRFINILYRMIYIVHLIKIEIDVSVIIKTIYYYLIILINTF